MIINGWDFGPDQLLTPSDVAKMFRVDPKTVVRWSEQGKLTSLRTLGGFRRYSRQQVEHYLRGDAWRTDKGRPAVRTRGESGS